LTTGENWSIITSIKEVKEMKFDDLRVGDSVYYYGFIAVVLGVDFKEQDVLIEFNQSTVWVKSRSLTKRN
jgi:hypothetical protein